MSPYREEAEWFELPVSAGRGNVLLAFLAACPDMGQESKKQVKLKSCQQLNIKKWRQILHYKWFENCTCQYLRKNVQFYICISDCVSLLLVCCCSVAQHVQLIATPWIAGHQPPCPSPLTISPSLPKFTTIALVMPSSHLILWHPLLLLTSIIPASGTFQWVCCSHQMNKILELQLPVLEG